MCVVCVCVVCACFVCVCGCVRVVCVCVWTRFDPSLPSYLTVIRIVIFCALCIF